MYCDVDVLAGTVSALDSVCQKLMEGDTTTVKTGCYHWPRLRLGSEVPFKPSWSLIEQDLKGNKQSCSAKCPTDHVQLDGFSWAHKIFPVITAVFCLQHTNVWFELCTAQIDKERWSWCSGQQTRRAVFPVFFEAPKHITLKALSQYLYELCANKTDPFPASI